jgi:uncharacterized protein (TIGR02145 family)
MNCKDNTIMDVDGNVYHSIKIGTQTWMIENLKATRYQNGDLIQHINSSNLWGMQTKGAWCNYENDTDKGITFGRLYNWYAVNDERKIAPEGWHIPTDAEWTILTDFLGGEKVAGRKLKETGSKYWKSAKKTEGTNETGFTALPGGCCGSYGKFANFGIGGYWWSATEYYKDDAWRRYMFYSDNIVARTNYYEKNGFSVRCLKD